MIDTVNSSTLRSCSCINKLVHFLNLIRSIDCIVLVVIVAILADKLQWRGVFILIFLPLAITGDFLSSFEIRFHVTFFD